MGLRTAGPTQCVADLLEREFAAYHRVQNVRSDLADRLHSFAVTLAMEDLAFAPRHGGEGGKVGREHAVEIDRRQLAGQPGVVPVMPEFLPGGKLLLGDMAARDGAVERIVGERWPLSPR